MPSIPSKESQISPCEGPFIIDKSKETNDSEVVRIDGRADGGVWSAMQSPNFWKLSRSLMHGMLHACPEKRTRCSGLS